MTRWISHRGIRGNGRLENTIESFDAAVRAKFNTLETDLRLTKDGHIVLCHDMSLERVFDYQGRVCDMTADEIRATNLPIVFFEEFMQRYAGFEWVWDIKEEQACDVLEKLWRWATEHDSLDYLTAQSCFLVWTRKDTLTLKGLFPNARIFARLDQVRRAVVGALLGSRMIAGLDASLTYAIPPMVGPFYLYNNRVIDFFKQQQVKILSYLPDKESDFELAMKLGFDDILSDGFIRPS